MNGAAMYKIETTDFGVRLTFGGFIKLEEMSSWVAESEKALKTLPPKFGVMVDMRNLKPLPAESQVEMQKGQKLYKEKGMVRSVVVVDNATTRLQFRRIASETGIDAWERYLDSSHTADWDQVGRKWLMDGIDPDL